MRIQCENSIVITFVKTGMGCLTLGFSYSLSSIIINEMWKIKLEEKVFCFWLSSSSTQHGDEIYYNDETFGPHHATAQMGPFYKKNILGSVSSLNNLLK
jgi:hypothetical protein